MKKKIISKRVIGAFLAVGVVASSVVATNVIKTANKSQAHFGKSDTVINILHTNDIHADVENLSYVAEYKDRTNNVIKGTKYYWFQNLIKKGDTVTGEDENVRFEPNKQHDTDGNREKHVTYLDIIKDDILNEISNYAKRNFSVDSIKSRLPIYATIKKGEQTILDGKNVTITGITEGFGGEAEGLNDEYISNLVEKNIETRIFNYGNSLLKQLNKEIDKITVKDISGD